MKSSYLLLFLFVCFNIAYPQVISTKEPSADAVLSQVSERLNNLKNVSYDYTRKLHYYSENYHNEMTATVYLDFTSNDTLAGFKYQVEDSLWRQIFNGTEKFELDKKDKTIRVNEQPKGRIFHSLSFLYNSMVTLKNIIPALLANNTISKTISDTIINGNRPYYCITVTLHKAVMDYMGKKFDSITNQRDILYTILVNKNSYLPGKVFQTTNVNNDSIETDFDNIAVNKSEPSTLSWFYSTYITDYKPVQQQAARQTLPVGTYAPDWTLPFYNSNENIMLADLKGKVVLIDFWIKNCGPCIESVPHLNALREKFKHSKFSIYSINSYDTREEIKWFCNKHNSAYNVLMNGKEVAAQYGVNGFPALFIIDKQGKIIYSATGFRVSDQALIEGLINGAL